MSRIDSVDEADRRIGTQAGGRDTQAGGTGIEADNREKGMHKRLFAQVPSMRQPLLMGVSAWVGAVAILVGAYALARIVTAVFAGGASLASCGDMLAVLVVAYLVRGGASLVDGVLAARLSSRMTAHFRTMVVQAVHGKLASLGREEAGELVTMSLRGAEDVSLYYAHFLPQVVRSAVIVPMLVLAVVWSDWRSALVLAVTIPLLPLFMALIGRLAKVKARRQWQEMSRLGAHLYDVLAGLGTLRLFGRSKEQAQVVRRMSDAFAVSTLQVLKVAFLSAFVLELTATLATAIAAVAIGLRLLTGELDFVVAFGVLLLIPEVYLPLRRLGAQFHTAVVSLPAAVRLYELADSAEEAVFGAAGRDIVLTMPPTITVSDVSYAYGAEQALRGASLVVRGGCVTALVGRSGSGKTTLMKVVAGLLAPSSGAVSVDGVRLDTWSEKSWRAEVGYALQQVHMFRASVRDNIAWGSTVDMARVVEAARYAGAEGFIASLPQGYDTMLGAGGHPLSGGQMRRIALARAFYHGGHVLLLDEWTQGLDAVTERAIESALPKLTDGRTVLMVAHRTSTVMRADYVAVMDNGTVVEYGTPSELLAQGGAFSRLVGTSVKRASGDTVACGEAAEGLPIAPKGACE